MKKTFRAGIAFLLVLALVLYLSPVRVSASALPETAQAVCKVIPFAKVVEPAALGVGGTVFCWVAMGLGVIYGAVQAVQAYNDFQDFTGELETTIYYYPDGSWSYGVDMGFVEKVRAYLFNSGTIANVTTFLNTSGINSLGGYIRNFEKAFGVTPHCYWYALKGGGVHFFLTRTSVYLANGFYYPIDGSNGWCLTFDGNSLRKADGVCNKVADPGVPLLLFKGGDMFISSSYEIGVVAPPEVDISVGYPEWYTNARPATNPDTQEQVAVLPVPLNPGASPETQIGTLTQPDVWQGSIADPMPEPEPLPDSSIAETPWGDVQDWLTPSGDPGRFGLQLRDYFPFCIPFDLFDFLTVLVAEPEAPCFVWEIPVPQMGRAFTVEVDLSAWDSVAALFRKLELLAFIVGLGWVTREKIRG